MNTMPLSLLDKKYKKICLLGEGSYGSVYLYQMREDHKTTPFESTFNVFQEHRKVDSQYVAVKIYKKPNTKSQGIDFSCLREITCLQVFEHENIMSCIEVLYNHKKESQIPYQIAAVMNFHLELKVLLERSGIEDKKRIAKQVVMGINHLHQNYYFHRDLKPDNIFVSRQGYVKLADFGFTKEFGTPYKKYTYNACTIQYRAPEVFMGTHYYTQKSDIWSIGCLISFIFSGKTMFEVDGNVPDDIDILSQIFYLFGTPTKEVWPGFDKFPIKYQFRTQKNKELAKELGLPQDVGIFLEYVMQLDPVKRPSAQQILTHHFFAGVGSEPFDVREVFDEKIQKMVKDIADK